MYELSLSFVWAEWVFGPVGRLVFGPVGRLVFGPGTEWVFGPGILNAVRLWILCVLKYIQKNQTVGSSILLSSREVASQQCLIEVVMKL